MRLPGAILIMPAVLAAQVPQPIQAPGLVRGTLLECETTGADGELSLRSSTHEVFRFTFDRKTYFELENGRIAPGKLKPGDLIEVVADRGTGRRYARTVHVVDPPKPVRRPTSDGRQRAYRSPIEHIVPTGTLTFSGILHRVSAERVVLRMKDGAEQLILLRQDTRFLDGGEIGDLRNLKANLRVFIRAGKDLYGEVEAFQIIHGQILQPDPR